MCLLPNGIPDFANFTWAPDTCFDGDKWPVKPRYSEAMLSHLEYAMSRNIVEIYEQQERGGHALRADITHAWVPKDLYLAALRIANASAAKASTVPPPAQPQHHSAQHTAGAKRHRQTVDEMTDEASIHTGSCITSDFFDSDEEVQDVRRSARNKHHDGAIIPPPQASNPPPGVPMLMVWMLNPGVPLDAIDPSLHHLVLQKRQEEREKQEKQREMEELMRQASAVKLEAEIMQAKRVSAEARVAFELAAQASQEARLASRKAMLDVEAIDEKLEASARPHGAGKHSAANTTRRPRKHLSSRAKKIQEACMAAAAPPAALNDSMADQ